MAKVLFAISLLAISIGSTIAYEKDCAVGPEYWCQSFEHAQDCGALRHCSDTVWNNDNQIVSSDSPTNCQWCERILENIHTGLGDNEDMLMSTLASACRLLPSEDLVTKCNNAVENYATPVGSLLKNKRFTTLCRLMDVCTTEKPAVIVGGQRCTWGPSYWCSSLSNSRECSSIEHCSNEIWSQQAIQKKENDNICQYCQYVIDKLRSMINDNQIPDDVNQWLTGACKMLEGQEAINQCTETMGQYDDEILVLIQSEVDPGIICHLGQMCKDATIIVREKSSSTTSEDQPKMLCNVIVRATHDLHVNQGKNVDEIETFLKNDCQQLPTTNLQQKCGQFVEQYGRDIYSHVVNKMELSKICDNTVFLPVDHTQCDQCTFILTNAKSMFDAKSSKDDILTYIDQQICSRLQGDMKQNCQTMLKINDEVLINLISQGTQPLLTCTYFQMCFTELVDETSPIGKDEMRTFLQENICGHLGIFENACNALMGQDSMGLLKSLVTDVDGDVVCQLFGVCPRKISEMGGLTIGDDTRKCQRCIDDFTRRKHIGEKLVNMSAQFLEHLCGQLPKADECTAAVKQPIDLLRQFIQSLDPKDICVELKACNASSLLNLEPTALDHAMSEEASKYIKEEICAQIGPLSNWCIHLIDSEGANLFQTISKRVDPHRICSVLETCPTTHAFDNCNDKCECCISKMENYQLQLATFLHTMLATADGLCESVPQSEGCREIAAFLKSSVDQIISNFDVKGICQAFTHCPASTTTPCDVNTPDRCSCCEGNINQRQTNFREIADQLLKTVSSFCTSDDCHSKVRTKQEEISNQISSFNPLTLCQRFGFCSDVYSDRRSIPFLTDLMATTYTNLDSAMDEIAENLCADLGDFKLVCQHLTTFKDNARYYNVYLAFVKNQTERIDQDFRAQSTNTCDGCKQAVQTAKDFWTNTLTSIRDFLLQTCDYCTVKDQCRDFYNQRYNDLKSYIDQIDPEQFCRNIHLCSIESSGSCGTCVERLDGRKDAFVQAIDRLAGYFNDLCQKHADKSCQTFVQQMKKFIQKSITNFDSTEACTSMGFCGADSTNNNMDFDEYQQSVNEDIEKNICSTLGPFEALCQAVIQGDTEQIQTLEMNYDLDTVMQLGEESTEPECSEKCRCCMARVQRRKRFAKMVGDAIYMSLIRSCDKCPAKRLCRQYYRMAQARFDKHIDQICPYKVCQHMGFCNKTEALTNIETQLMGNSNSNCKVCGYVMEQITSYVHQQLTEEQIEEKIRLNLRPLQTTCDDATPTEQTQDLETSYDFRELIQVDEELADSNCTDRCKCCIARVQERKKLIKFTGDAIFMSLMQGCDKCPARDQCRRYYRMAQARFDRRIDQICPYMVCKHFGFCNKTKESIHIEVQTIENSNSTCILCEYVMNALSDYLHEQSTEEEIEENLQKICTQFPSVLQNQCREYIENYSPTIVALLLNEFNLSTVCQRLNLCTQQMNVNIANLIKASRATCGTCNYISTYIQYALQRDPQEQSLQRALAIVCTQLSDEHRSACQTIVQLFAPYIQQLALGPDNNFCKQLPICLLPAIELTPAQPMDLTPKATPKCTICLYVMSYLDAALKNNKSEAAIEEALGKVCSILPDKQRSECEQLVKTYGPVIAEMIAQSADPNAICRYLGFCEGSIALTEQTAYSCNICQYVLSRMKLFFGLSENEDDITKSLQGSCDLFSLENLKQECRDFLNRYQAHFAPIISDQLEVKIACQSIDVCINRHETTTLSTATASTDIPFESATHFGKCIFGMNYWCTSRETAIQCNALELCELHVWSKKKVITN